MLTIRYLKTILVIVVFVSCTFDNKEDEYAHITDAQPVNAIDPDALIYDINKSISFVVWTGSKPAGKHFGTIDIKSGFVTALNNRVNGGEVVMDISTITSLDLREDAEKLNKLIDHLKSPDFFDAENYPTAIFQITNVIPFDTTELIVAKDEFESEYMPESASEYIITNPTHKMFGNLTIRGTTFNIAFPAKIKFDKNRVNAIAKFNIDRTLWNLKYRDEASVADKTKDRFIYNTVNIGFRFIGERIVEDTLQQKTP